MIKYIWKIQLLKFIRLTLIGFLPGVNFTNGKFNSG